MSPHRRRSLHGLQKPRELLDPNLLAKDGTIALGGLDVTDDARLMAYGFGYAPSMAMEILPRALRFFHETNSGVRVRLHDMSTQEILHGLSEGKLNVAFLVQVPHKLMTGLTFEELHRCPVCVAVHPAHRLAQMRKVCLEQVARERLITYTAADYPEYRAWLAGLFASLKLTPQIAEEYDSATSVIAAAEAGRGVALVTQDLSWLAGPSLKVRPLIPAPPALICGIAYRKGVNSPMVKNFIVAAKRIDSIAAAQVS